MSNEGQYKALSPWTYFWLKVLYSVPVVGFVFLIVFSCSSANINRRNFTRSYWCGLLLTLIIIGVILLIALVTGSLGVLISALVAWLDGLI